MLTKKNLHSHNHRSPISNEQEVINFFFFFSFNRINEIKTNHFSLKLKVSGYGIDGFGDTGIPQSTYHFFFC
jgi:hypothetical protein